MLLRKKKSQQIQSIYGLCFAVFNIVMYFAHYRLKIKHNYQWLKRELGIIKYFVLNYCQNGRNTKMMMMMIMIIMMIMMMMMMMMMMMGMIKVIISITITTTKLLIII